MKNRILTLILSLIFVGAPVYSAVKQDITGDTYYQITRLSTPTIKIGGRDCKIGDSFQAGEKIDWTDSKQWMLVMNNATKKEVRFSKRTNEKMGLFESLLSFFMERTKGSTRGTYDYIRLVQNPDSLAFPEKRIALIVGIQNYPYMAPLKSAQKDAEDISDALFALGFDVMELYDSDYSELRAGLNKFAGHARNYDTAFIYFAGHGIQDNSICYLLPVNYDPEDKVKGLNDCVSCNSIIHQLENLDNLDKKENSRCKSRIFFFDACRESSGETSKGLENMVLEGKPGSVIIFATQSGSKAKDGDWDKNSPFAEAVLRNLNRTASFADMMEGLVHDTYYATDCEQFPVKVGSLVTDFRFTHKPEEYSIAEILPTGEKVTNVIEEVGKNMSANELFEKGEDFYEGRNGEHKNHVEAIKWYTLAATKGHVEAMYSLGYMHGHGEGTDQNHNKACEWYKEAAERGFAKAQYFLGFAYAKGEGIPRDISKAIEWYGKAAGKGLTEAQMNLAQLYENGYDGHPKNYAEAAKWYQQAADQGFALAQLRLGDMYFYGRGVEKDYNMAVKWYEVAADHGSSDAQCNLGYMYEKGYGDLPQSTAEAYNLYYKAADKRNRNAQFNLGVMYENGTYVKKDLNEAKRWYRLAAEQGEERAKMALERLK